VVLSISLIEGNLLRDELLSKTNGEASMKKQLLQQLEKDVQQDEKQDAVTLPANTSSSCANSKAILFLSYNSNPGFTIPLSKLVEPSPGYTAIFKEVGEGKHLEGSDPSDPLQKEPKRWWMWRWRLYVDVIKQTIKERNGTDFLVFVYDSDVLPNSGVSVKDVMTKFASIEKEVVFAGQIYCCNPYNLRERVRDAFAKGYEKHPPPKPLHYLNAGSYFGCANSIVNISEQQIGINKAYVGKDGNLESLVDDDEFNWGLYFGKDRVKPEKERLTTIDYDQSLVSVTATQRVSAAGKDKFTVWSPASFVRMFGKFYGKMNATDYVHKLGPCRYTWDDVDKVWVDNVTGVKPLFFHFAGGDWLCRCRILQKLWAPKPKRLSRSSMMHYTREACEGHWERWEGKLEEALSQANQKGTDVLVVLNTETLLPETRNVSSVFVNSSNLLESTIPYSGVSSLLETWPTIPYSANSGFLHP